MTPRVAAAKTTGVTIHGDSYPVMGRIQDRTRVVYDGSIFQSVGTPMAPEYWCGLTTISRS